MIEVKRRDGEPEEQHRLRCENQVLREKAKDRKNQFQIADMMHKGTVKALAKANEEIEKLKGELDFIGRENKRMSSVESAMLSMSRDNEALKKANARLRSLAK